MPQTKTKPKSRSKASDAAPDALALLRTDHRTVQDLFKQYEKLTRADAETDEKQALAARICMELTVHAQIEEEIFYPALREVLEEQDLLDEAEVEHATAKDLITQLEGMDADEPLYDAKVTVLGEYVNHHVDEEERELFKQAKAAKVDLSELGEELAMRQKELKAEMGLDDEAEDDEED